MIDGESSKAELLVHWRYDCSYSDVYFIKSVKIWYEKQQLKLDACTITLKELLLDKQLLTLNKRTEAVKKIVCDSNAWSGFCASDVMQ